MGRRRQGGLACARFRPPKLPSLFSAMLAMLPCVRRNSKPERGAIRIQTSFDRCRPVTALRQGFAVVPMSSRESLAPWVGLEVPTDEV